MIRINLDDGLNGNWLANRRKIKQAKGEKEKQYIAKREKKRPLIIIKQSDVDKALGEK